MMIEEALETFVRGYCFTRSLTHPYVAERIGPVWVMRDAPRTSGDWRTEEYVAYGREPAEVDRQARRHARGRYCICAFQEGQTSIEPLRDGFKALGYRLNHTESLMVHPLQRIPRCSASFLIKRVRTSAHADAVAKAARRRQIRPEHLGDPAPQRTYAAWEGDKPLGWVSSIVVGDAAWCANMFVLPDFRRRGIGRALLSKMLRDDRASGALAAVLLASHTGAKLYPLVGYQHLGTLLVFSPKR